MRLKWTLFTFYLIEFDSARKRRQLYGLTTVKHSSFQMREAVISLLFLIGLQLAGAQMRNDCSDAPNANARRVCQNLRRMDQTARSNNNNNNNEAEEVFPPSLPVIDLDVWIKYSLFREVPYGSSQFRLEFRNASRSLSVSITLSAAIIQELKRSRENWTQLIHDMTLAS